MAPIVWRESVREEWIDYNGHLSEAYYVLVFGHATDEVMDVVGMGPAYRSEQAASMFTAEAHVRYLDQVALGEEMEVRSHLIGHTAKALWIWHELWVGDSLRATEEVLGIHVDTERGGAVAFPAEVAARIGDRLVAPPAHAGRAIGLR